MTVASEPWILALGTMPVDEGFRMLERDEVRFFPSGDPARFQKLCTISDLHTFLASDIARTPRVGLADSRREGNPGVPYEEYTIGEHGQIDLPRLFALHDAEASLWSSSFFTRCSAKMGQEKPCFFENDFYGR
jgi:hypothetical protein